MNRVRVTAAVIMQEGRVLLAQRKPGDNLEGKWEFPGGKIEPGETPELCLKRELYEELRIVARIGGQVAASSWDYPHVSIELIAFEAEIVEGTPIPRDHAAIDWVAPEDLLGKDLAEADIPIAEKISRKPA